MRKEPDFIIHVTVYRKSPEETAWQNTRHPQSAAEADQRPPPSGANMRCCRCRVNISILTRQRAQRYSKMACYTSTFVAREDEYATLALYQRDAKHDARTDAAAERARRGGSVA